MTTVETSESNAPVYRIGAVAKLTGISPDTIRVWERRYEVVTPQRAESGNRLYSKDDVARLALIKRLVDNGHAIGTVAHLSREELQERLETLHVATHAVAPETVAGPCSVVLLGDALPARLAGQGLDSDGIETVGSFDNPVQFETEARALHPDVVVMESATVHEDSGRDVLRLMEKCGAGHAVVVYCFGTRNAVRRLNTTTITALRAPADVAELKRACLAGCRGGRPAVSITAPAGDEVAPERRFDSETLAYLSTVSTAVRCECPHHLAELVFNLGAFETYSAECENRSPEDAALHAYLHATAGQARAMIEEALARLVEADGIELPGRVQRG